MQTGSTLRMSAFAGSAAWIAKWVQFAAVRQRLGAGAAAVGMGVGRRVGFLPAGGGGGGGGEVAEGAGGGVAGAEAGAGRAGDDGADALDGRRAGGAGQQGLVDVDVEDGLGAAAGAALRRGGLGLFGRGLAGRAGGHVVE